jgi:hypothetical protein
MPLDNTFFENPLAKIAIKQTFSPLWGEHTSNGTMVKKQNVYFSWVAFRHYKHSTNILNYSL